MSCIGCNWIRHQHMRTGDYYCGHPDEAEPVVVDVYATPDWCPKRDMAPVDIEDLWRRLEDVEARLEEAGL